MPRAKRKVYIYNEKGKYIKNYESVSEFCKAHFNYKKGVFADTDTILLEGNNLACINRTYRNDVVKLIRKHTNPFNKIGNKKSVLNNKHVLLYDVNGKFLAEFANIHIAAKLTNEKSANIYCKLKNKTDITHDYIKYKFK